MNITILGAGSWAIALAVLLDNNNNRVTLWEFNHKEAELLRTKREHPLKLPGITINDSIEVSTDIASALDSAQWVVCAVPSQFLRSALQTAAKSCNKSIIDSIEGWIIVSKGIECSTLKLMSEILSEELPRVTEERIAVVSGPSHAEEVARKIPTSVVAASSNATLAQSIQQCFSTDYFRVYTNDDIKGVEIAGATKNVIAIAAGICDGLGFGDNTKGALLTRGLVEMTRLGLALGAKLETFSGLAGMGDLITTCISKHSRNRTVGESIGKGGTLSETLKNMVMVAEGVETTRSVYQLSQKIGIDMPITEQIYLALFQDKPAALATRDLMLRANKAEGEFLNS